jgi:integrase
MREMNNRHLDYIDILEGFRTMSEVPELGEFRDYIDDLGNNRDTLLIKSLYLTASRCEELLTRACPSDKTTRALGHLVDHSIYHVKTGERDDPILVFKVPVLKRRSKKEQQIFKIIALPCNPEYEPWTLDLLRYITQKNRSLSFDLTRGRVYQIVKAALKGLDSKAHPHSLRHYRLTHLVLNYNFKDYEVTQIAGWTTRTGFSMLGSSAAASPNIDIYLHLRWKEYIPKLLVPLRSAVKTITIESTSPLET